MSTKSPNSQECTDTVPRGAGLIGIDAEGARHYLGNRVAADGVPVYVQDTDGDVEFHDLTETPCATQDDIVEAWMTHVKGKRGEWIRRVYNQPLAVTLAESVEEAEDWDDAWDEEELDAAQFEARQWLSAHPAAAQRAGVWDEVTADA